MSLEDVATELREGIVQGSLKSTDPAGVEAECEREMKETYDLAPALIANKMYNNLRRLYTETIAFLLVHGHLPGLDGVYINRARLNFAKGFFPFALSDALEAVLLRPTTDSMYWLAKICLQLELPQNAVMWYSHVQADKTPTAQTQAVVAEHLERARNLLKQQQENPHLSLPAPFALPPRPFAKSDMTFWCRWLRRENLPLEIRMTPRGRGLFATKAFKAGEAIVAERPYASVWLSPDAKSSCSLCFTRLGKKAVKCASCKTSYCGAGCRDKARSEGHAIACGRFEELPLSSIPGKSKDEMPALVQQLACRALQAESIPYDRKGIGNPLDHLESYEDNMKVVTTEEGIPLKQCDIAVMSCIEQFHSLRRRCKLQASPVIDFEWVFHTVLVLRQNSFGIFQDRSGTGIYPVLSLFNHACEGGSNAFLYSNDSHEKVAYAARDIAAGEEITHTYVPSAALFLDNYGVPCTCSVCAGQVPKPPRKQIEQRDKLVRSVCDRETKDSRRLQQFSLTGPDGSPDKPDDNGPPFKEGYLRRQQGVDTVVSPPAAPLNLVPTTVIAPSIMVPLSINTTTTTTATAVTSTAADGANSAAPAPATAAAAAAGASAALNMPLPAPTCNCVHTHCVQCGEKEHLMVCSRCRTVSYCSATCQKNHWRFHKVNCKSRDPR